MLPHERASKWQVDVASSGSVNTASHWLRAVAKATPSSGTEVVYGSQAVDAVMIVSKEVT